ncbi:MAG: hypothetical protein KJ051_10550 [Thermoleophilia bacterium]|nr:hypothetical protein [Thermoleophilia bacterium]
MGAQTTLPAAARRELCAGVAAMSDIVAMVSAIVQALGDEDVRELVGPMGGEWDPEAGARADELSARWAVETAAFLFHNAVGRARLAALQRVHGEDLPSETVLAAWREAREAEGRLRALAAELGLGASP